MRLWVDDPADAVEYLRGLATAIEDGLVEARSIDVRGSDDGIVFSRDRSATKPAFFAVNMAARVISPASAEERS